MLHDKNIFIGLFLFIAIALGLGMGYFLTRFMNKIHKVPKSPDELESLVMLEARKKVSLYHLCALVLVSLLLSDRIMIEKETIRTVVIVFIFGGFLFERFTMKAISKKFAGN